MIKIPLNKSLAIFLFALLICFSASAQNVPLKYSLEEFTPKITAQDGANCFAYASAYVALSTQYAFKNHITADSIHAFSFGFVDGAIHAIGSKKVRVLAHDLFGGDINTYGNLDDALFILIKYGTVHFSRFPYTLEKEINRKFNKGMLIVSTDIQVNAIKELVTPADFNHADSIMLKISKEIFQGHPIICAIREENTYCNSDFVTSQNFQNAPEANHVVNVIGYDVTAGTLRIKNNFKPDCCFDVPLQRFCNSLSWAYVLILK